MLDPQTIETLRAAGLKRRKPKKDKRGKYLSPDPTLAELLDFLGERFNCLQAPDFPAFLWSCFTHDNLYQASTPEEAVAAACLAVLGHPEAPDPQRAAYEAVMRQDEPPQEPTP